MGRPWGLGGRKKEHCRSLAREALPLRYYSWGCGVSFEKGSTKPNEKRSIWTVSIMELSIRFGVNYLYPAQVIIGQPVCVASRALRVMPLRWMPK